MNNQIVVTLLLLVTLTWSACDKDEEQGIESIQGEWTITSIKSFYGEFTGNGHNGLDVVEESGELGTFSFGNSTAEFNFIRNDTTYTGNGDWVMTLEKVNAGFSKENLFTLSIDNHFTFEVEFEDGTSNAEKNATSATFITTPPAGFGVMIEMELEKQ